MPAHTPTGPITIAKREGQAGVLPISAVAHNPKGGANNAATRNTGQRLKVVIRRLPPGLTEQEFFTVVGEEWKAGKGKVSWASYRPGKVSKDLAKYSKPARCFLQLNDSAHAQVLAQQIPKTSFTDAKGTQNDPVLLGPPQVEYAIYGRVPNCKRRNDARQGTIDQDPEFMDFLQSLTAPIQKPKALDSSDTVKEDNVRVTPLIQHLREKKAAREKSRSAKQEKQLEDKKAENQRPGPSKDNAAGKDNKAASPLKTPAKPAGKDIRSPPRNNERAGASPRAQAASVARAAAPIPNAASGERRRPGAVSPSTAAARMLSRDLPFQSNRGRAASRGRAGRSPEVRKATINNAAANGNVIPPASTASPAATAPASPQTAAAKPAQPNGQPISPSTSTPSATPTNPPTGPKATSTPTRAPSKSIPRDLTAKRAFLKHANASQGINDLALLQAMRRFGFVTNVSIDNRKGFAYVDFAEPDHLKAAMAASPVPVAQGNVEVLELKNPTRPAVPPPPSYGLANGAVSRAVGQTRAGVAPGFRGGRGGSVRGGRGGRSPLPARAPVVNGAAVAGKPIVGVAQPAQETTLSAPAAAPAAPAATTTASADPT